MAPWDCKVRHRNSAAAHQRRAAGCRACRPHLPSADPATVCLPGTATLSSLPAGPRLINEVAQQRRRQTPPACPRSRRRSFPGANASSPSTHTSSSAATQRLPSVFEVRLAPCPSGTNWKPRVAISTTQHPGDAALQSRRRRPPRPVPFSLALSGVLPGGTLMPFRTARQQRFEVHEAIAPAPPFRRPDRTPPPLPRCRSRDQAVMQHRAGDLLAG